MTPTWGTGGGGGWEGAGDAHPPGPPPPVNVWVCQAGPAPAMDGYPSPAVGTAGSECRPAE